MSHASPRCGTVGRPYHNMGIASRACFPIPATRYYPHLRWPHSPRRTPMKRRAAFALLFLLLPVLAQAQEAPEQMLPATTQVYLRWDGVDAHRAAYDKSSLGQMMQGDTGGFVTSLYGQLQDGLSALLTVDQLLGGVAPDKLAKMQTDAAKE